jgi:predicted RNase H-like HicB family nuclease
MNYPIVIHKDRGSDYGVTVPDLPGCFSAGSTLDEAMAMAKEAIELHLEGLIEEGLPVPEPRPIQEHHRNPDYADAALWGVVTVDESKLPIKAVRLNITMPQRIVERVDRFAQETGDTRSGLLVRAVSQYMAQTSTPFVPTGRSKKRRVKSNPRSASSKLRK